jgi:hypothetical protein
VPGILQNEIENAILFSTAANKQPEQFLAPAVYSQLSTINFPYIAMWETGSLQSE